MIRVVAHVTAIDGHQDALRAIFEPLIAATRAEPGCEFYDLHVGADPQVFTFIEGWATDEDLDRHLASDHMLTALRAIEPHVTGAPDIRRFVRVDV